MNEWEQMEQHPCTCQFLPCICTFNADDGPDDALLLHADIHPAPSQPQGSNPAMKSKLRSLFAANAMTQCSGCMFLPCICPAEDPLMDSNEDEVTSLEAASPVGSSSLSDHDEEEEEADEYGRVPLQKREETDERVHILIAKEIKRHLKPHQVEGVQFLYDNIVQNRGCILADYMGLGKTLQVITVIYSFLVDRLTGRSEGVAVENAPTASPARTMVLCPAICIPNWEAEFKKWLAPASQARCPIFTLDTNNVKGCTRSRIRLLQQWKDQGGVLLIGYEMYRSLLNPTATAAVDRDASIQVCTRVSSSTMQVTNSISAKTQKASLEFYQLLCHPGPSMVVLDEGHRMKDPTSLLCQSVAKIRSKRRLVLTGYPVQNSLSEYWCMVNFARENFLGTYDAFRAQYEKPIVERNDVEKSKELIEKLKEVVLRRGKALLRKQLPPKKEWILYCKLSEIQHQLYCDFLEYYGETATGKATADLLTAYAALLQVMNHPDIIHAKLFPGNDDEMESLEDSMLDAMSGYADSETGWGWESEEKVAEKRQAAAEMYRKRKQKIVDQQRSYEWARKLLGGSNDENDVMGSQKRVKRSGLMTRDANNMASSYAPSLYQTQLVEHSGKMAVLMRIIEESLVCGDKVVVFSQSVPTLKIISDFLRASSFNPAPQSRQSAQKPSNVNKRSLSQVAKRPKRDPAGILRKRRTVKSCGRMGAAESTANEWFLQIDGSTMGAKRMEYIERFSAPDNQVKLLLVSTRAGAEGINLHAANRLVLFDVSWNPSNDHQSMCRSHRIGQSKTVHVYRLVSTGTMERMIYEQQMKKVDLSTNVVDQHHQTKKVTEQDENEPIESPVGPYSGFLRPPSTTELSKSIKVDKQVVADDHVLTACLEKAGHWLVDVYPVHDPTNCSRNQNQ